MGSEAIASEFMAGLEPSFSILDLIEGMLERTIRWGDDQVIISAAAL